MFVSWMRTVAFGESVVAAAGEPSLERLSTTTTSIGTSALASSARMHWRRRSLTSWLTISAETIGLGASGIAGDYRLQGLRDALGTIWRTVLTGARTDLRQRLVQLSQNRLIRQNAILFPRRPSPPTRRLLFPPLPAPIPCPP